MAKELTWPQAIEQVLGSSPIPLHYAQITEEIVASGLRKNLGATPAATVGAHISASIKEKGDASPYRRVAKGTYTLAAPSPVPMAAPSARGTTPASRDEGEDEQATIITSFGMFWRREFVKWERNPKLLGLAEASDTPVDFQGQRGIYLLYDGREVIYVGRVTDRPLGARLFEHTRDRLATRWDRFSWFGLLAVDSAGELGEMPASFESRLLIPALASVIV
jgi:hypothetical protein